MRVRSKIGDKVRELYYAEPFRPFIIQLKGGRRLPVNQRDWMMLTPSGRTVGVSQADDSFELISSESIAKLDTSPIWNHDRLIESKRRGN